MSTPDVSVILPVFNAAPYLADAIDSIMAQDHLSFELLILNDGSTDNSHDIIRGYLGDQRVRYVERENRGLGETLNELVGLSHAPLVARMDADDISFPERLTAQCDLLDRQPDIGMCGTDYEFLVDGLTTPSRGVIADPGLIRLALLQGRFPICHPTLMFRRRIFESIGGYRLRGCGEDLDMFLRFSEAAPVTNIDQVLFRYRLHAQSLAASRTRQLSEGYAYARACARARAAGEREIEFEAFVGRKGAATRIISFFYARWFGISEALNRKTIVCKAKGQRAREMIYLFATACLRPRAAASRALQLLSNRLRGVLPKPRTTVEKCMF